jgi:hypothetical protein
MITIENFLQYILFMNFGAGYDINHVKGLFCKVKILMVLIVKLSFDCKVFVCNFACV